MLHKLNMLLVVAELEQLLRFPVLEVAKQWHQMVCQHFWKSVAISSPEDHVIVSASTKQNPVQCGLCSTA